MTSLWGEKWRMCSISAAEIFADGTYFRISFIHMAKGWGEIDVVTSTRGTETSPGKISVHILLHHEREKWYITVQEGNLETTRSEEEVEVWADASHERHERRRVNPIY
jgi:hypothetical protein